MIQSMLQWNTFQILEFLAAVIVFVFLLIFDFEKKTATDAISKAVLKILQNSKENIYMESIFDRANIESCQFATY